jgi:cell fate (sporulation/competence/biofilm development) regulator YmcA (YheA/YmcA/DUF963 family)
MEQDLSRFLRDWKYEQGTVSARWVRGDDGKPKIQLRLDLGILQMELDGRPDGHMPHGYASLLDYYRAREKSLFEKDSELVLDHEHCSELQQEAVQYYYRYLAFAALHYADGVIRDTQHNLDLFEMVDEYADDDDDVWQFLQFYPYVRMMNARACADKALGSELFDEAAHAVESALDDIRLFLGDREYEGEDAPESREIAVLEDLLNSIREKKPRSPLEMMREEMEKAIRHENYERAAELRDALRRMAKGLPHI